MRYQALTFVLLTGVLAGCVPAPQSASKPAAAPASPAADSPAAPAEAASTPTERVVAEAGVGKKGQSLKDDTGIVVEPVKQLIKFEQKAVFDLQIKPALEFYKASNGSYPKTNEEFMTQIIKANGIELPALPEGQTYVFDPEQGQLMVERPQQ
ncbi:MAG: hypothetical protein H6822_34680 [Planctomycetaceae bacterium]|nr:hypothetical protein [Planctomycetales bacterium]MCB9927334.1 hypothetical protein [Planctomycetaceae bacterium]